ncbi:MAG TPA: DUF899 family protein [Rhodanobacteraceae bacterium]|nr:DUF899 family protein [Rhodanobacteraceae bacterium]
MSIAFRNETHEYREARNALLDDEVALRRQMESVAAKRRALPPGPAIAEDYAFETTDGSSVKLSELFRPGNDTLLVYAYMFPRYPTDERRGAASGEIASLPRIEQPCPSCTALLDQIDAAAKHYVAAGGALAVVANTTPDRLRAVAGDREWKNLRLLSSKGTSFKRDYHAADEEGRQEAMVLVFKRDADGTIRLFWASELAFAKEDPGQDKRVFGTLDTFWNLFDFGPHGRPDFQPQLSYGARSAR